MITNTELKNLFGRFTRNNSTVNLDFGAGLMNVHRKTRLAGYAWPFLEVETQIQSIAGQAEYFIPNDISKIYTVVYDEDLLDLEVEVNYRGEFEQLRSGREEGYPRYFYIRQDKIVFYPTPGDTDKTIYLSGEKRVFDLEVEDTTAGTIDVTNGSTVVAGSGTGWSEIYNRSHILLPDKRWYKVDSVVASNSLLLEREYEGDTATSQTYTMGELEYFPDGFEYLALYDAVADYFRSTDEQGAIAEAQEWERKADDLEKRMYAEHGNKTRNIGIKMDYPRYIWHL